MQVSNAMIASMERVRIFKQMHAFIGDLSHSLGLERIGPWLTERIFWRANTADKVVALSFDDGPHERYTPALLRYLEESHVPATFFMIGRQVRKNPDIARDVANGPHEIGNHTFTHPRLPMLGDVQVTRELAETHDIIRDVTGREPVHMRPPMGLFTKRVVNLTEKAGYRTVVGDVYPRDPHKPGTHKIVRRVLGRVQPGSLIILHDGGNTPGVDRSQTVDGVKEIVPRLQDKGYRFVTLSELVRSGNEM